MPAVNGAASRHADELDREAGVRPFLRHHRPTLLRRAWAEGWDALGSEYLDGPQQVLGGLVKECGHAVDPVLTRGAKAVEGTPPLAQGTPRRRPGTEQPAVEALATWAREQPAGAAKDSEG